MPNTLNVRAVDEFNISVERINVPIGTFTKYF